MSPSDQWREKWKRKVTASQLIQKYRIGSEEHGRVRYGDETDDWGATQHACGDCAVEKGRFHVPSCDIEQCPKCGGQAISCDCGIEFPDFDSLGND